MTVDRKDDPTTPDPNDADTGGLTLGEIRKLIQSEMKTAGPDRERPDPRGAGRELIEHRLDRDSRIAEDVAKAVADLKAVEDRDRREKERDGMIAALKEKVEEKVPRKYTKFQEILFGKETDD